MAHIRDDVRVDDEAAAQKAAKESDAVEAADRVPAQEKIKVPEVERPAHWIDAAEVDSLTTRELGSTQTLTALI